jgi:hypothetical protein
MHIITLMDYSSANEIIMCKAWIYFAKKYNPLASITIFSTHKLTEIQKYSLRFPNISFKILNLDYRIDNHKIGSYTHPHVQELQLSLWKEIRKYHINSFIYIDADAFILSALDDWERIINEKPYIAIGERYINSHLLFNAGVFSYHSKNNFVTFGKLINQYKKDGNQIILPAGQQGLINKYFSDINYDWSRNDIGYEYNSLANYCEIEKLDNEEILIFTGKYPLLNKLFNKIGFKNTWLVDWIGWRSKKKVKILHAFGGTKFWDLPECKPLWEYCKQKIL